MREGTLEQRKGWRLGRSIRVEGGRETRAIMTDFG